MTGQAKKCSVLMAPSQSSTKVVTDGGYVIHYITSLSVILLFTKEFLIV